MKVFKMIKKFVVVTAIAAMTLSMAVGCSSGGNEGGAGGSSDTLNFACTNFSDSLDPAANTNAAWAISRYGIAESLFKFDEEVNPVENLCDKYEVDDSHTEWKFHIREGVKFSNGKDVTASAVQKSIQYMYDREAAGDSGTFPSQFMKMKSIEADDESGIVTIITSQPYANLCGPLGHPIFGIIDVDAEESKADCPIGTGPYKVVKKDEGTSLALEANEHYWNGDVPFAKLNIMFVKEDTSKSLALQNGDVDVVENITAANELKTIKDNGDFQVSETVGGRTGFAYMNQKGILKNDDLRKAILMSVDDETLCNVTIGGMYAPGYSVLPSSLDYGYENLKDATPYDLDAAKKILDDAGIVDTDNDGYRELDGKNVELNFLTYDSRNLKEFTEGTAANIEQLGLKVNIKETDADTEWNMLINGEYDLLSNNWLTVQVGDPVGYLENWYSKSNANYCGYSNPEFDKLYEATLNEMDDAKRKDMIEQMQQILIDDAAVLVHGYYKSNICSKKTIEGAVVYTADYYWMNKDIKPVE